MPVFLAPKVQIVSSRPATYMPHCIGIWALGVGAISLLSGSFSTINCASVRALSNDGRWVMQWVLLCTYEKKKYNHINGSTALTMN
jgi:hypothetical protein